MSTDVCIFHFFQNLDDHLIHRKTKPFAEEASKHNHFIILWPRDSFTASKSDHIVFFLTNISKTFQHIKVFGFHNGFTKLNMARFVELKNARIFFIAASYGFGTTPLCNTRLLTNLRLNSPIDSSPTTPLQSTANTCNPSLKLLAAAAQQQHAASTAEPISDSHGLPRRSATPPRWHSVAWYSASPIHKHFVALASGHHSCRVSATASSYGALCRPPLPATCASRLQLWLW